MADITELAQTQLTQQTIQQISKSIDYQKRSRPYGDLFARPVDYVALQIPDYPNVIKKPMDYTTLQKNLNAKMYQNLVQFLTAASLIFSNCRLYNGDAQESYFYTAADVSEQQLVTSLQKHFPELTFENYKLVLEHGDVYVEYKRQSFDGYNEPRIEDIYALVKKMSDLPETLLGEVLKIYFDAKGIEIGKFGDYELDIQLSISDSQLIWKMMAFCDTRLEELRKYKKKQKK